MEEPRPCTAVGRWGRDVASVVAAQCARQRAPSGDPPAAAAATISTNITADALIAL